MEAVVWPPWIWIKSKRVCSAGSWLQVSWSGSWSPELVASNFFWKKLLYLLSSSMGISLVDSSKHGQDLSLGCLWRISLFSLFVFPCAASSCLCLAEVGSLSWLQESAMLFTLCTVWFQFLSFCSVPVVQQTISGPVLFSLLRVAAYKLGKEVLWIQGATPGVQAPCTEFCYCYANT